MSSFRHAVARRLRRATPLILVGLLSLTQIGGGSPAPSLGGLPAQTLPIAVVAAQALVLWWLPSGPVAVLLAVTGLDGLLILWQPFDFGISAVAVAIAAYNARRHSQRRRILLWLALAAAASLCATWLALTRTNEVAEEWTAAAAAFRVLLIFLVPIFVADLATSRAERADALRQRAQRAEQERERMVDEAIATERALMARELHDIAAHHLSGIVIGAQAASALMSTNPPRADEYVRALVTDSQQALQNLRDAVGLLRSGTDTIQGQRITDLPRLAQQYRAAGVDVRLEWDGPPGQLGPLAESTAYRMVEESLTNVGRHAPGTACVVRVTESDAAVTISVENTASAPSRTTAHSLGYGLIGMRERALLVSGELHVGPLASGGWRNTLTLPRTAVSDPGDAAVSDPRDTEPTEFEQ